MEVLKEARVRHQDGDAIRQSETWEIGCQVLERRLAESADRPLGRPFELADQLAGRLGRDTFAHLVSCDRVQNGADGAVLARLRLGLPSGGRAAGPMAVWDSLVTVFYVGLRLYRPRLGCCSWVIGSETGGWRPYACWGREPGARVELRTLP